MNCRFCSSFLKHEFISLGSTPLSNALLSEGQLGRAEAVYPLKAYVCENCFLVQVPEFESPENIFDNYLYFSSYSETWLKHAEDYVEKIIPFLKISKNSFVVEIASNDGYLLQYFVKKGIPVLGVEPAQNVADIARQKGIPTEVAFFGVELAKQLAAQGKSADLIVGNNVLAHVPDLNDFVKGLKILLKPQGTITLEFPHLMNLIEEKQFDTIYHEHFSYFSLITAEKIFTGHGFTIFDVETLPTHGGSLRIYAKHREDNSRSISNRVTGLIEKETEARYTDIRFYLTFEEKIRSLKNDILKFFNQAKKEGKTIVGYGAPAKGNTLLNYCGIGTNFIEYTVDKNPHKQSKYLPGSHILIESPKKILKTKPDYLLILPWNLKEEIIAQNSSVRGWGGKFVTLIPEVRILK
ncbi:MAG: class I SAM-dependent methyltransferase [Candidatus Omnitrophica bacterium]|nr:class I SAM-dependent methyltransferase [Candidatus Omnitrophota bacterium]